MTEGILFFMSCHTITMVHNKWDNMTHYNIIITNGDWHLGSLEKPIIVSKYKTTDGK